MGTIGIIILLIIAFVCFGLLGWVLKAIGAIIEFLFDGCAQTFGCLIWIVLIIMLIIAMI